MKSPISTTSPSCKWMCLPFGIRYSTALRTVVRVQRQAALVLVVAPELDRARLLGDDRRVLRPARLEQLRHARQAARDVARLGALSRDAGQHVARLDARARIDRDDRVDRQEIAGVATAGELGDLAVRRVG